MSLSQNYGVLRVVHTRSLVYSMKISAQKYSGWLQEERPIYLLSSRVTTIGRSLGNELILLDPTVSRVHARLTLDDQGWHLTNLTEQNSVYVNGELVAGGDSVDVVPQDMLLFGSTLLQLVAPIVPYQEWDQLDFPALFSRIDSPAPSPWQFLLGTRPEAQRALKAEQTTALSSASTPRYALYDTPTILPLSDPQSSDESALSTPCWSSGKEGIFGAGLSRQFALPSRLKSHMRWWITGISIVFILIVALLSLSFSALAGLPSLIQEGPLNIVSVLAIPILPALGINLLVHFMDRYGREPWLLRLAAFLWGAIIAIPPTLFIEQYIQDRRFLFLGPHPGPGMYALFSGLNAGVTEETVKGLGLLLLFFVLRDEFDNITDGVVYGALIGAGFAMVENFFYFYQNPRSVLFLIIGRIVLGWLSHSTFTVCFGLSLGYIRHTRSRWQHIFVPLLGYLAAVGLHTLFDFISAFVSTQILADPDNTHIVVFAVIAYIADYILPLIAQLVIMYCLIQSLSLEAALMREFLASEVCTCVISVDEYALLQHSFIRARIERHVLIRYGVRQWFRVRRLYQTEIELAFRKWHANMGNKPDAGSVQSEERCRKRIRLLRQQILTAESRES